MFDRVWMNAHLATMNGPPEAPLGLIEDGAVACRGGRIAWVGRRADLPEAAGETVDCGGAWILPGLIDCHTHLVFGGNRAAEFEQRLAGATYEQIARAGGGIFSSVRATRAASSRELFEGALLRLQGLMSEGVTTVEIKSGYGLQLESELKMLRVARRLGEVLPVEVVTTLLAAHAVPPEFPGGAEAYARHVAEDIIPASVGLADAVDAFCEGIAFSPAQTARVFAAARAAGLPVKLHADQLSDLGGAALAAAHGALSADHLEHANPQGLKAMAEAGTVAVLLPGATYFLREARLPDIAAMREAGLRMALSTDMNPGSSPARSLLLMLNMGCTLFRLTVEEALLGVTRHAAAALGLRDRGMLRPGLRCDLSLFQIARPAELCYWLGGNPCQGRVLGGREAASSTGE
ncbi:imidazolonepropionase [Roseomonas marmotae]|uniref:Imidazolonepropionase n=1 Tax=Roseomonas marmotae TaxID=2768161 RepID=A0ABS3KAC9_9PROT|nr:imidazolonepropionase [Roseomonas marmotae]MBO1074404.1 imidazolonepropionase [Roseomonas marmotae]QTI78145.1 imidazolonepropionase [Roseomonas marmotae]